MADWNKPDTRSLGARARDVAILLIAKLWPGEDFASVEARFDQQSPRIQSEITLSVTSYLFLLALFAGQFGPIGLMVFLAAVLVAVR